MHSKKILLTPPYWPDLARHWSFLLFLFKSDMGRTYLHFHWNKILLHFLLYFCIIKVTCTNLYIHVSLLQQAWSILVEISVLDIYTIILLWICIMLFLLRILHHNCLYLYLYSKTEMYSELNLVSSWDTNLICIVEYNKMVLKNTQRNISYPG